MLLKPNPMFSVFESVRQYGIIFEKDDNLISKETGMIQTGTYSKEEQTDGQKAREAVGNFSCSSDCDHNIGSYHR